MAYNLTFIGSPNFWDGRSGKSIDRIVIHWMDGTLAGTDRTFQDENRQTSAHYGIENKEVHQYVKIEDAAWHSGSGNMNLRSIGIEHSAAPGRDASAETIQTSAELIAKLCKDYNIPCDRVHIIKHSEVIATTCPGTIPIDDIISRANKILSGGDKEMVTDKGVEYLFRALLGRSPDPTQKKELMKAKTFDETEAWILSLDEYKRKVADAKALNFSPASYVVHPYSLYAQKTIDAKAQKPTATTQLKPGIYEVK